jgi:predicted nucleic acid-binding Zn ribbon protein
MPLYQYSAGRKSDGVEIVSGMVDDALSAGAERIKLVVMAGLLLVCPLKSGPP